MLSLQKTATSEITFSNSGSVLSIHLDRDGSPDRFTFKAGSIVVMYSKEGHWKPKGFAVLSEANFDARLQGALRSIAF